MALFCFTNLIFNHTFILDFLQLFPDWMHRCC